MRNRTLIIAECGSCHDNDVANFRRLIHAAASAGVDMVKFQWTSDPRQMAARRHAPELQDTYSEYLAWPAGWHRSLAKVCHESGLLYGCTVYLPEDVPVVAPHVAHFKIASFEAQASDLLAAYIAFLDLDVERWLLVSRGLGVDGPLVGLPPYLRPLVKCLLCTSAYPAPVEALNLRRLHLLSAREELALDGLSDHSPPGHTWTGALAVAAGATIVERHLRLDDTDPANPDYPHSLPPRAFADYVTHIRYAESCLGDGRLGVQACEQPLLPYRVLA